MNITLPLLSLFLLFLSINQLYGQNSTICGFWQGPHPNDPTRKFYLKIDKKHQISNSTKLVYCKASAQLPTIPSFFNETNNTKYICRISTSQN